MIDLIFAPRFLVDGRFEKGIEENTAAELGSDACCGVVAADPVHRRVHNFGKHI